MRYTVMDVQYTSITGDSSFFVLYIIFIFIHQFSISPGGFKSFIYTSLRFYCVRKVPAFKTKMQYPIYI